MSEKFPIMGKTYKGLEEVLAKELKDLGAEEIEVGIRAVSFKGDKAMLYRANLCCRTATRFLVPLVTFTAQDADELYDKAKGIDWSEYMSSNQTFSIDTTVYSENFTHSKFVAYRVKDAIADQFNEKDGKRPSVSLTHPDLMVNVHIADRTCTISLDSSGESLHKRGYRISQNEAPISEALAAGMLLLAGWKGDRDFIDPMCGSGTIVIEAALIALNIPPGIFRKEFAFEKWRDFDADLFDEIYNDDSYEREFNYKIYGSDISRPTIQLAEENVKSAGLSKYIELQACSIENLEVPASESMLMVTNPPYGERLKDDQILDLYGDLGRLLKRQFAGNDAWVISSQEQYLSTIGMKPSKKIELVNGKLDCLYCHYEVFAGTRKDFVMGKIERGEYHKEQNNSEEFDRAERGHFRFEKEKRVDRDYEQRPYRGEKRQHSGRRFYSDKPGDRNYGGKRPTRPSRDEEVGYRTKYSKGSDGVRKFRRYDEERDFRGRKERTAWDDKGRNNRNRRFEGQDSPNRRGFKSQGKERNGRFNKGRGYRSERNDAPEWTNIED